MKIDLHLHSLFSKRPSQWILQKIGCPESFSHPRKIYDQAREMGMDEVTLTDHNSIAGALEIAHLPHAFISEEITTYFPEDGCKMHVLAWEITEQQHLLISKLRENIYDLVGHLNQENIRHCLAHPLSSVNGRLSLYHFERCLLLFKNMEINGGHSGAINDMLRRILEHIDRPYLEHLADKHNLAPACAFAWEKNLLGGSDDHSGLHMARMHTVVQGAETRREFFERALAGQARVEGASSTPETLAHNLYGIAYQFYRDRFGLGRHIQKDLLFGFLERILGGNQVESGRFNRLYALISHKRRAFSKSSKSVSMHELFMNEARRLVWDDPDTVRILKSPASNNGLDSRWFAFADKVSSRLLVNFGDRLFDRLSGADVFDLFASLGSAGALYTVLAPYFVAYSICSKDRQLARNIQNGIAFSSKGYDRQNDSIRVGHFTDTFYEVNGVALTLRQMLETAAAKGHFMRIITCDASRKEEDIHGVRNFRPVGVYSIPEYPEQKLFYPPFLQMLQYCHQSGFSHIHSATPGPIGLAALGIAKILHIPIVSTYHTSLPQYTGVLTGDSAMEDAAWKFVSWYYQQVDKVFVSSQANGDELMEKGIAPEKIILFPRGIDVVRFSPSPDRPKKPELPIRLLYVGRVSLEKNLEILVGAFLKLLQEGAPVNLTVVGDGPYLEAMKENLCGTPTTFTGYLDGNELAQAYHKGDIFVFPSTTDTFGNVVLEAQASGMPVIVSDKGGPAENIVPGKTGILIPGNNEQALVKAIAFLVENPHRIGEMGLCARQYMQDRSFESAFDKTWEIYTNIRTGIFCKKNGGWPRAEVQGAGYQYLVA